MSLRVVVEDEEAPTPNIETGIVAKYLEYSKDMPSPLVFRKWTAIHAVGASAERRVWCELGNLSVYPNLFIFLVGPPGTGKSVAINPMSGFLRKSQAVELAPNDMTKQGLLDALAKCTRGAVINGKPFDYTYMSICISELSNFMPKYDVEMAGLLTDLFDCLAFNDEKKRSGAGKLIPFPGLSFVMGTATENLGTLVPMHAWGSGFMARVIMVYSGTEVVPKDMFAKVANNTALGEDLSLSLRRIGQMKGEMIWHEEAREAIKHFRLNQTEGAPLHNRLTHYVKRRWIHLFKLCMIAALSEEEMFLTPAHYARGLEWLLAAEKDMVEVFKDMVTHEDGAIYEELKTFVLGLYMSNARKPIPNSAVVGFLAARASTAAVPRIIDIAMAADYIRRVAGTFGDDAEYVPGKQLPGKAPVGLI